MRFLPILLSCWMLSQAHAGPELDLALKGGPYFATLDKPTRVHRPGLSGGLAASLRWPSVERLSLAVQAELLYAPRGSEVVFEGRFLGKSRQHYLDVALAVRPGVRAGKLGLYVLLGGSLDVLLRAHKEDAMGARTDITDGLRRVDLALLVGAGVALQLPPERLGPLHLGTVFLEARHDRGLIDTDTVNGGYKNRASSLMLGVSFAVLR